jgi:ribosomal protein L7Ae-like RNA K-turn-binding protein
MNAAQRQKIMRLLGLGVRGRGAVVGVNQVRESARSNKVFLAVVATDASENSLEKIVPLLNARRVRFIEVPSAVELGTAVGRDQTAVVGVVDRQLAAGIRAIVEPARQGPQEDV